MSRSIFAAMIAATVPTLAAAQQPTGSYNCVHTGNGACSVDSEGRACIGGAVPRTLRHRLQVNFDSRQIRLNGLRGDLEVFDGSYSVQWRVAGLGSPVLALRTIELRTNRQAIILELRLGDGDATVSEFRCQRVRALRP